MQFLFNLFFIVALENGQSNGKKPRRSTRLNESYDDSEMHKINVTKDTKDS